MEYDKKNETIERCNIEKRNYLKFSDLNRDGIDEIIFYSPCLFCGSGGCYYPIITIDLNNKKIREIGLSTSEDTSNLLPYCKNGWRLFKNYFQSGVYHQFFFVCEYKDTNYKETLLLEWM